ncbi:DUF6850 family outer membrane beta-barrel protein [Pedobacter metabolipauper]|uniref:DUF6850 domain-containing protein n=1 Tax=Pedobacter metabolipauper TaxID=425513 RepID=A0A4R6SZV1_9SPHI|nr:DUF6850 family outer membrane beta-barrel protein [Pedobacter metabolipauper]TDQ11627.1 hypothetical protein ATK78_0750 [Pedobacter metabolipauper]
MKLKTLFLLMMLPVRLLSQESKPADSIYFYDNALRNLKLHQSNGTFLLKNKSDQISLVSLDYDYQDGSFKKSQTAGSANVITFSADGIKKIGKFNLYGNFTYQRIKEEELAYALRGEEIDDQPFYYSAGYASKFSRQNYNGKGIVSYQLLKNKLYLSSGFNYKYYLAYRSTDPRMNLDWFDFKASPELTLLTKNINVGISGTLGYGTETIGTGFKNNDYAAGVLYPDRILYVNNGYGFYKRSKYNRFSRRKQYKGLGMHVTGNSGPWDLLLSIDYLNSFDKNQSLLDKSVNTEVFTDYTSKKITGSLLLTKRSRNNINQIELTFSDLNGEDYIYEYSGKNYTAKNQNAGINFMNSTFSGHHAIQWGTEVNYNHAYKKDALSSHLFEYSNVNPGIHGAYYHTSENKDRFSVLLSPSLILPFNVSASAPLTQETDFTKGVMYPDYAYHLSTSGMLNLKLNYISTTLNKSFRTGITLNTSVVSALKRPEIQLPAYSLPGKYRFNSNLSLNLYF